MARNRYDEDESLKTSFNFNQYKRALAYVLKYKKGMMQALFLSVLAALFTLSAPLIISHVVDEVIQTEKVLLLLFWTMVFFVTVLIAMILTAKRAKIMAKVGQAIVFDIRSDLFTHLQYLPFDYYDQRPDGKILIRVVNYVNSVSDMLSNGLINLVLEIINIFIIMGFMFFVNIKLSLIILSGVPFGILAILIVRNKQRKAWQNLSNKASNTNAYLQESISGMEVTQIYNREPKNLKIFSSLSDEYRTAWLGAVRLNALFPFVVDNLMNIITMAIYGVGLLILDSTTISLGVILAMGTYALRFWNPILNIANIFNSFVTAISYLERIFETLDEPLHITDKADAVVLRDVQGKVRYEHVFFAYEKGQTVLKDISFEIQPGKKVAIVGATGAGKTSIVNLLSRFYDLNRGQILIDEKNIQDVTLKSLRKNMGIMMQDSYIFETSIKENIRYGNFSLSDDKIEAIAKALSIHDFIMEFDAGYDTQVSNQGGKLSAGQKQLVAMARTMAQNPRILILDEATASIDTHTEMLVQKGLNTMMEGRTSFIIAHRLSTIQDADVIFYMDNQKIEEMGSHQELMALRGKYYELVKANVT